MRYKLAAWAVLASFIAAFFIEYYLIVMETYVNLQSAFGTYGGISIYVFVTLFTLLILKLLFRRINGGRFLRTFGYALLIIIPIGLFWSMYQGYMVDQLLSPEWEFTHDFVYVTIISQIIILSMLLLGTREDDGEEGSEFTEVGDYE